MKKILKRLSLSILAVNLAFLGLANTSIENSYAAEASANQKYKSQKEELTYAVADRATVVSSEAFNSYASENSKAAYEKAIANGQRIIEKGNQASLEELAQATANINEAKATIRREVDRQVKMAKLREAVEDNKLSIKSARFLLENAPNSVAKVKSKLIKQIQTAESIIQRSEALLQRL